MIFFFYDSKNRQGKVKIIHYFASIVSKQSSGNREDDVNNYRLVKNRSKVVEDFDDGSRVLKNLYPS